MADSSRIQVAVALIGVFGVIGGALISSGYFNQKSAVGPGQAYTPPAITSPGTTPSHVQPKPHMTNLMGGLNLPGNDLYNPGIQVSGAQECSDICLNNDACKAMTFVKHPSDNGGVCWQKRDPIPASTNDGEMVSAIKRSK